MTIFPNTNKLKTLLSIKKKIDTKNNIITFLPAFAVCALGAVSVVAFVGIFYGITILSVNFFEGRNVPDLLSNIFFSSVASVVSIASTYILFKLCEKLESYIYRKLKGKRVEEKILQLIEKNKSDIVNYLEELIEQEPDKEIYGYAVNMKRMLADSVKDDNMSKFIKNFENLYKAHELKPLNNNEEDYLEHEIGATNNIKKYL
jgi:hypothetical protein